MGKLLQAVLKRPMHKKCNCIRCKSEDFVRSIYPEMDDHRVLLVATSITKALQSSVAESRRDAVGDVLPSTSALSGGENG